MNETEYMQIIGDNIKSELKNSRMSQKQLSKVSNISEATISRYINGEVMPTISNINNIATALCITIDDLVSFDGDMIEKI